MLVYITTIILSVFFAYIFSHSVFKGKEIPKWIAVIITALPSILVTGLRYYVGSDYGMYRFAFANPDNVNIMNNFEILNRLFFKAVTYFGGSFYTAVFIFSLVFFILVYIEIFNESPMPWLSTFMLFGMLFFFIYMNAERQMVAISILMFSLRYLKKRKYLAFFVLLAFATCIHKSSILFVLVLLLYQMVINFKVIFSLTPVIFAISAFSGKFINSIATFLKYENYIQMSSVNINFRFVIEFSFQLIITILACYVYEFSTSKEDQNKYHLFFNIQVLTLWTYAFSGFISGNEIARIRYIFSMPGIIFVPMVLKRIPQKIIKLMVGTAVVIYGVFNIYYLIFINNEQQTLPYRTIISIFNR